ncbi:MAG: hypothetical protein WCS31_18655 [Verrucomicrobiae bacterium]
MSTTHPSYSLKSNEADARRHLDAFWLGKSLGRPALAITARNPGHVFRPFPGDDKLTGHEKQLLPEWHAHNAENALNSVLWLGESLPKVTVSGGITFFNELLGGTYTLDGGTAWVDERTDILERPLPRFDPSHPLIVRLDERIRAMAEVVGRRGYVNPPFLGVDPLTALSLFRGGENLCLDLVERAEEVIAWCAAATEVYIATHDHFFQLLTRLGHGENSSWYESASQTRFEAIQCDAAVMISPDMFEEFVLPDLARMTAYLDRSLYHLDGIGQLRFLEQLATLPRLNGIQWNPEPSSQDPLQWLETFRDIRNRGWLLLFNQWECRTVEQAVAITASVGTDGLFLTLPTFDTEAEAHAAIAAIEQAT